jgi:cytochrome c
LEGGRRVKKENAIVTIAVLCLFVVSFMLTGKEKATAAGGKTLFSSSVMGQNGKTCSTCHPGGKGLESVAIKTEWKAGGTTFATIEGAINACVKGALKGRSLKEDSLETKSLALYLDRYRAEQAAPAPAAPAAEDEDEDEDQFGC